MPVVHRYKSVGSVLCGRSQWKIRSLKDEYVSCLFCKKLLNFNKRYNKNEFKTIGADTNKGSSLKWSSEVPKKEGHYFFRNKLCGSTVAEVYCFYGKKENFLCRASLMTQHAIESDLKNQRSRASGQGR